VIVYQHSGLRGLELWQGLAGRATLYQLRDEKAMYFKALAGFLEDLHEGIARTAGGDDLGAAAGFDRLILTGGDAAAASAAVARAHVLADPGPFAARRGAEAVWREFGWRRPLALDLGQSRLKIMDLAGSRTVERDPAYLPFGRAALPAETGRERLREWLRPEIPGDCDGVVVAVPAAISLSGRAESCTFPGLFGDLEGIFGALFAGKPWVVVNDAVLAARGYPPERGEKTLVVTLGFGVGGALWALP
jgi:hypothetical protein